MLGNGIAHLAPAPESNATFALGDTLQSRESFRKFADGSSVFVVQEGAEGIQLGHAILTYGTPDTLTWTTVIYNSAGTQPSRMAFTAALNSTIYVYNQIPAEYAIYRNPVTDEIDALDSDLVNVSAVNGGPVSGFRDALINGTFDVWQSAVTWNNPASDAETADTWRVGFNGSGSAVVISRQAATTAGLLDEGLKYFFRYARGTAGTGGTILFLYSRIEAVGTYASKTVTLSFWAKADSARNITPVLEQNFGTGGSPSSVVDVTGSVVALTTSWVRYTQEFVVPSIVGKTLGSNGDDYLQLSFNLPLNVIETIDFAGVRLRDGTDDTPDRIPYADRLAKCQRYRCPIPLGMTGGATSSTAALLGGCIPVPMRATPAVVGWNNTATLNVPGDTTYGSNTAPTVSAYDPATGGIVLAWTGFTGLTTLRPAIFTALSGTAPSLSAGL